MSAKDHLQGEQLRMFMPAKDLIKLPMSPSEIQEEVDYHKENGKNPPIKKITNNLWKQKLTDSQMDFEPGGALGDKQLEDDGDTLYDSIQKHGVINPVTLGFTNGKRNKLWGNHSKVIIGGHHRIAAAHDINPDMEIPVTYK